jgi:phosphoglycolate phosphatase-like HAD superfamily hydrolase
MTDYPIEPDKLLEAAGRLTPPGRGRPPYTAHRRAVSTAYYAVFHAITDRVVKAPFTEADTSFRRKVRRWIQHGDIKTVATWIGQLEGTSQGGAPAHIKALLTPADGERHIDEDTRTMAEGFLELNEKREQADYDHDAVFTRPDTLDHLARAGEVVAVVEQAQSDAAKRFFGLIAMQAKVQARR